MYLDYLFYKPLEELLKLSDEELQEKKERAILLISCLDSVMKMKKNEEAK